MSNKGFKPGNKAYTLRKSVGRPKVPPIPSLAGNKTFRHTLRMYIREQNYSVIFENLETDTVFDRLLKKAARDLIAESTPIQAIFTAFNYLEPIPKSELEGDSNESMSATRKDLVEKIEKLSLEGLEKIDAIIKAEKCMTQDDAQTS